MSYRTFNTNSEETLSTIRYLGEPNAVYLDGVGHDGDSPNAGSSDGPRVADGMAEMKMVATEAAEEA